MSATLDVAAVQNYLQPCALLSSAGRTYQVTVEYLKKPAREISVWELTVRELEGLLPAHPEGDALVFMPGAHEIMRTVRAARDALGLQYLIFPLHGELPPADQDAAIARYDRRKIIVATNVAQTSLTIDGVRLVIDSGLARVLRHDPHRHQHVAAAEGFDIRKKPVAPEVSSRNGALTKVAASSWSVVEEVKRDLRKKSCSAN